MNNRTQGIRLGTRGSALALWQARSVAERLGNDCTLAVIETSGDRFLNVSLQGRLEKGFFTKEIEEQLQSGEIDAAVHSLKDMPTRDADGLVVGACLERGAVGDLLLIRPDCHAPDRPLPLQAGCRVGATSLRRQALLAVYGPDCEPAFLRGNVPTRIGKCLEGQYGAIILARAGIERLRPDLGFLLAYELNPDYWLPSPGQGTIAVQARAADQDVLARLRQLDHEPTRHAAEIERQLLARFEGGCHTAFGALARQVGDRWEVRIGLDRPGAGWRQACTQGCFEACMEIDPAMIYPRLSPLEEHVEGLCRQIQW